MKLEAGESNYTELGVETGLAGALALHRLEPRAPRRARPRRLDGRSGRGGVAAALAAVLALAIQTDVDRRALARVLSLLACRVMRDDEED